MKSKALFLWIYTLLLGSLHAQNKYFPPYYPTLNGVDEYAAWYVVYPDSLLRKEVPGEAVCTVRIDNMGNVTGKQTTASHLLFARAAEAVIDRMEHWQPALLDGKRIDTTVVIRIPFNPDEYHNKVWRQNQVLEPCRGQHVDALPAFPDKIRALVMGNMRWPDPKVQTAVAVCRFTVNAEGKIENAHILKGTNPKFDEEAVRILSGFPQLVPAQKGGKPVPFDYYLTINFWKLDLEYHLRYVEKARKDFEKAQIDPYTPATYPGGTIALAQFIQTHLNMTPEMKATGKKGRVIYSFDVDMDGSMKNFKLMRGLHPLIDAEALRVLQLTDRKWRCEYYFNTDKWYREFCVSRFTMPVYFNW